LDEFPSQHPSNIAKNIYITNDEEIKEGDWFYVKTTNIYGGNIVAKCLDFGSYCWSEHILTDTTDEKGYHPSHCVKIILTTDPSLAPDVQAIDDEFLEWFVKNPSCEEVMVDKFISGRYFVTNPIIPKEEPKQENCCTPVGQIKRYVDCIGCDKKPKQELERGITITHVGEQEMRLVNIETYDTKVYTFKNKEGELYHVIKQDSFLNNLYPEYRFIGPDQKEVADDESINEIKTIMKGWKK